VIEMAGVIKNGLGVSGTDCFDRLGCLWVRVKEDGFFSAIHSY
jgi:hypothetical protein